MNSGRSEGKIIEGFSCLGQTAHHQHRDTSVSAEIRKSAVSPGQSFGLGLDGEKDEAAARREKHEIRNTGGERRGRTGFRVTAIGGGFATQRKDQNGGTLIRQVAQQGTLHDAAIDRQRRVEAEGAALGRGARMVASPNTDRNRVQCRLRMARRWCSRQ